MRHPAANRRFALALGFLLSVLGGCDGGGEASAVVKPAVGHAKRNQVMEEFEKSQQKAQSAQPAR